MKSKSASMVFQVIVLMLAACSPTVTAEPQDILPDDVLCSVDPYGQGVYSGKNPKVQSLSILGIPHGILVYNEVHKLFEQIDDAPNNLVDSTENAVILVVDVFEFTHEEESSIPDPILDPTPDPPFVDPSVGDFNASFAGYDWLKRIDYWDTPAGNFTLVAVDTNELDADSILQNMEAAINLFNSTSDVVLDNTTYPNADHVVVNMSFAYVPCDPMPYIKDPLNNLALGLPQEDMESLEKLRKIYDDNITPSPLYNYVFGTWSENNSRLVEQLGTYPDPSNARFEAFITSLVYSPDDLILDNEAFTRFSDENAEWIVKIGFNQLADAHPDAVFIGAAGNFKLPYPLYPAAMGPVISVSSSGIFSDESCRTGIAEYSNCGEIKLDGIFFDDAGIDTGIAGTSFASPEFSFWAALHLIGNQLCPTNTSLLPGGLIDLNNPNESAPWNNFDFPQDCLP